MVFGKSPDHVQTLKFSNHEFDFFLNIARRDDEILIKSSTKFLQNPKISQLPPLTSGPELLLEKNATSHCVGTYYILFFFFHLSKWHFCTFVMIFWTTRLKRDLTFWRVHENGSNYIIERMRIFRMGSRKIGLMRAFSDIFFFSIEK